jgi:hypothetical protein
MRIGATTRRVLGLAASLIVAAAAAAGCAASGSGGPGGGEGPDAGSAGSGVDAGSGGEGTILPENLIDDLEDGDASILPRGGRVGAWYTYNDKSATGTQTPAMGDPFKPSPGGVGDSQFDASTTGTGFSVWGAGMGFDLDSTQGTKSTYDVSAFTGIRFRAKGTVPMRAAVMIAGVVSLAVGGTCVAGSGTGQACDDGHGRLLVLTADWKSFDLPFAQLTQGGWGKPVPFDPATVLSIQFNVDKNLPFDVSIDDIGFY